MVVEQSADRGVPRVVNGREAHREVVPAPVLEDLGSGGRVVLVLVLRVAVNLEVCV